jgi:hypothetical protein
MIYALLACITIISVRMALACHLSRLLDAAGEIPASEREAELPPGVQIRIAQRSCYLPWKRTVFVNRDLRGSSRWLVTWHEAQHAWQHRRFGRAIPAAAAIWTALTVFAAFCVGLLGATVAAVAMLWTVACSLEWGAYRRLDSIGVLEDPGLRRLSRTALGLYSYDLASYVGLMVLVVLLF